MLEHEPGGTVMRLVPQINAGMMKIQPGMCSGGGGGGGADHGGCKGGEGCNDRGLCLQRPDEGVQVAHGSPRALAARLSSGSAGFDVGGQVAIGISHWSSPFPAAAGRTLPSPDCVHSEAAGIPPISGDPEPVSCPASLSITPLPSLSGSQETLNDTNTSTYDVLVETSNYYPLEALPCSSCRFHGHRGCPGFPGES
ncbi:hypothetical protein NHX12_020776 [Muraenolepis orangiensis]|uniref:Uncharacterized protein n=1 Tax=Muraenolepis orangiensis TaxID=630683 RepID=A0A9Q0ESK5_9TELE|nr:hypothetical protein NHX12_020776 [Muraenolepis orangiensis]